MLNQSFFEDLVEVEPGLIRTKNGFGYMFKDLDYFSQSFVEFCSIENSPVLDMGACYGVVTLPALHKGGIVYACDMDAMHLEYINKHAPERLRKKLRLLNARFPDKITFPKNYFKAIHAALVLHFLSVSELQRGFELMWKWLTPGGKLFATFATPFQKVLENFIPTFLSRKKTESIPGIIDNLESYFPHRKDLPNFSIVYDDEVLANFCRGLGFKIEKISMYTKAKLPEDFKLDGREFVGIILEKP